MLSNHYILITGWQQEDVDATDMCLSLSTHQQSHNHPPTNEPDTDQTRSRLPTEYEDASLGLGWNFYQQIFYSNVNHVQHRYPQKSDGVLCEQTFSWCRSEGQLKGTAFQFSLRSDEVQLLAGWKLVFNNQCSVPENLPTASWNTSSDEQDKLMRCKNSANSLLIRLAKWHASPVIIREKCN